jgi:hypothetical protein
MKSRFLPSGRAPLPTVCPVCKGALTSGFSAMKYRAKNLARWGEIVGGLYLFCRTCDKYFLPASQFASEDFRTEMLEEGWEFKAHDKDLEVIP